MTSEFVLITPGLSAGSGGVADHTLALLREWEPISSLALLVADQNSSAHQTLQNVGQLKTSTDEILTQLPQRGGKVFVQYSAYGFNRLGYPRGLISALVQWKKRSGGL